MSKYRNKNKSQSRTSACLNENDDFLESCEHCEDLFSNWGMHLQFHNHAQFPFTSHKLTKIMSICVRIFLFVSYQVDCMFLY